jgi:hypothetical protein
MERNAALTTRGRTPKVHTGLDSQLRPHNYRLLKSTEVQTRGGKSLDVGALDPGV